MDAAARFAKDQAKALADLESKFDLAAQAARADGKKLRVREGPEPPRDRLELAVEKRLDEKRRDGEYVGPFLQDHLLATMGKDQADFLLKHHDAKVQEEKNQAFRRKQDEAARAERARLDAIEAAKTPEQRAAERAQIEAHHKAWSERVAADRARRAELDARRASEAAAEKAARWKKGEEIAAQDRAWRLAQEAIEAAKPQEKRDAERAARIAEIERNVAELAS
jgi:hypothetical protein